LVNKTGVLIHHVVKALWFFPVAFIFDERRGRMVNRWFAQGASRAERRGAREPGVKLIGLNP
jgi:hypothetical protein